MSKALKVIGAVSVACLLLQSAASAADVPTIRVGWTIPNEEAKYFLMRRPELFPDLGKTYKIDFQQFQGTPPMVQAMVAGALDCSTQSPLPMAQGIIRSGLQPVIVGQHAGDRTGYFAPYWAVKADSKIEKISDLKGKTIGVNTYGAGINAAFLVALKKNGVDPAADVKFVETGFPGSEDAIRTGRIDAGILNLPFSARAEAKGGLRKIFSSAGDMEENIHIMEVCSKKFVDQHPEAIKSYRRDLVKAMGLALSDREQAMKIDSEVTRAPVADLDLYLMREGKDVYRDPQLAVSAAVLQKMFDLYVDAKLIDRKLMAADYIGKDIFAAGDK